jgi:hypothetical protein
MHSACFFLNYFVFTEELLQFNTKIEMVHTVI